MTKVQKQREKKKTQGIIIKKLTCSSPSFLNYMWVLFCYFDLSAFCLFSLMYIKRKQVCNSFPLLLSPFSRKLMQFKCLLFWEVSPGHYKSHSCLDQIRFLLRDATSLLQLKSRVCSPLPDPMLVAPTLRLPSTRLVAWNLPRWKYLPQK